MRGSSAPPLPQRRTATRLQSVAGGLAIATLALTPAMVLAAPAAPQASLPSLVISEIVYDGPQSDAVELFNTSHEPVSLDGWSLHDDRERPGLGTLHSVIEPGQYLVLRQVNKAGEGDFDFGLGKGDTVQLRDANGHVVDSYTYEATSPTGAWARCGDQREWAHASVITLGAPNNCEVPQAPALPGSIVINEVDSSPADSIEFYNGGHEALDISGMEVRDNSDDHRWRFPEGSTIGAGEFLVVDAKTPGLVFEDHSGTFVDGTFEAAIALGSGDSLRLYSPSGVLVDSVSWRAHAAIDSDAARATLGRIPDGIGTFGITHPTLGGSNSLHLPGVAINEVESNGDATDWVEVINNFSAPVDISGWSIMDNDPIGHASDVVPVADGTILNPGEIYVFDTGTHFGFGLGARDTATLRNASGATVDEVTWDAHATITLGRCPDGSGTFTDTFASTKGALNACDPDATPSNPVQTSPWPGESEPRYLDTTPMFLADSSGLDYHEGFLWAIDNGTGTFWKLEASADGTVNAAPGWLEGKRARFIKDADDPAAAGPDAEGITVASDGMIYIASERDNSDKGVNSNSILQIDPRTPGRDIVANAQWDITGLVPPVSANMGIEAVEFVHGEDIEGTFIDEATGQAFSMNSYPSAVSNGVFLTALEANGYVYGFVLHPDGSATRVLSLDSGIGGAMSLDFVRDSGTLVIGADNGFDGVLAAIRFAEREAAQPWSPQLFARPAGMPNVNNEGFAIADSCTDGLRATWFFQDGVTERALSTLMIPCDAFGAPAIEDQDDSDDRDVPDSGPPSPHPDTQPDPEADEQPGAPESISGSEKSRGSGNVTAPVGKHDPAQVDANESYDRTRLARTGGPIAITLALALTLTGAGAVLIRRGSR